MFRRQIQARAAFAFAFSVILCFIIALLWSQSDWHKPAPLASSPPAVPSSSVVAKTAPQPTPPIPSGLDLDGIWRLAAQQPSLMADHLQAWLQPLMLQKSYDDVEGLSLVAILKRPWWYPSIAVFQEARVRALLAEGQNAQALSEAKSYYNLCPLNEMPTAIDLLSQALANCRGPAVANQFKTQATANLATSAPAPDVAQILNSIPISDSLYARGIEMTRAGSTQFPFANQISLGNLLLLADRPSDALKAFVSACRFTQHDWDLPKAIDGIARSLRARDGSLNSARQFLACLKSGEMTAFLGVLLPGDFNAMQLRNSARSVKFPRDTQLARIDLPDPPDGALEPVILPPASSERPFDLEDNNLPINRFVLASRLSLQSDAALRNWLINWHLTERPSSTTDQNQLIQLSQLLLASKLSTFSLLRTATCLAQSLPNGEIANAWLTQCAMRDDVSLGKWFNQWQQNLGQGRETTEPEREKLMEIISQSKLSDHMVLAIANTFHDVSKDPNSTAALLVGGISRKHPTLGSELNAWRKDIVAGDFLPSEDDERYVISLENTSGVPSDFLFQLAQTFGQMNANVHATAAVSAAAVNRAVTELENEVESARIATLQSMAQSALPIWNGVHAGDIDLLPSVNALSVAEQKYASPGSTTIAWALPWAKIAHAECLYVEGKNEAAIAAFQAIDSQAFDDSQKSTLAWSFSKALFKAGRYNDTIRQLRIITSCNSSSDFDSAAWALLAHCLGATGDKAASRAAFHEWVRRFRPQMQDEESVFASLEKDNVF